MKSKLTVVALMISVLTLTGCAPEPTMMMSNQNTVQLQDQLQDQNRVQVTRIGVFKDELAYSARRGVYVIVDTKTGKEYIGISGVGIQEVSSHHSGKTTTTVER